MPAGRSTAGCLSMALFGAGLVTGWGGVLVGAQPLIWLGGVLILAGLAVPRIARGRR